jgi:amino acid transporter
MGAAAPLSFVLCAAIMGLVVTAIATAGSRVALTGGIYAYVEVAFGPYVGFLTGVLQWLTGLLAVSGVATALLDQMGALAPAMGAPPMRMLTLVALFGALATVNVRGVRAGTRVIETMTVAKLAPLLILVVAGAFFIDGSALAWPGWPGNDAVGRSILLLIFAYSGVEVAIAPSGEVRGPARTVPRAVFLALTITTVLYIAIQLVAQGTLGADLARSNATPLADSAATFLGASGRMLMLLGAICSMFGYLSGDMLSSPRSLYALARDGFLPSVLARIDAVSHAPKIAICTHAILATIFASVSTFQSLAIMSNVGLLIMYLLSCAAAVELTRRDVRTDAAPLSLPGGHVWPALGAAMLLWVLSAATLAELGVTGVVLAIATGVYFIKRI